MADIEFKKNIHKTVLMKFAVCRRLAPLYVVAALLDVI